MGAYSCYISVHTHIHTHTHANTNSTQPDTLSHRLDRDTLPQPNQTPTTHSNDNLDRVYIVSCGIDIIVVSRGIDTCNRCILCPSLNVSCVFPFVQRSDRVASGGVQYVLGPATWAACPEIRTSEWATVTFQSNTLWTKISGFIDPVVFTRLYSAFRLVHSIILGI